MCYLVALVRLDFVFGCRQIKSAQPTQPNVRLAAFVDNAIIVNEIIRLLRVAAHARACNGVRMDMDSHSH